MTCDLSGCSKILDRFGKRVNKEANYNMDNYPLDGKEDFRITEKDFSLHFSFSFPFFSLFFFNFDNLNLKGKQIYNFFFFFTLTETEISERRFSLHLQTFHIQNGSCHFLFIASCELTSSTGRSKTQSQSRDALAEEAPTQRKAFFNNVICFSVGDRLKQVRVKWRDTICKPAHDLYHPFVCVCVCVSRLF